MNNCDFVKLSEIVDKIIDYRGVTPAKRGGEWSESGIRALSALNVKTRCLVALDKVRYVDEQLYKSWMKEEMQKGDIIITSEAPFGEVYYWNSDEKIVLSQRLYGVRLKPTVDNYFVFQYMTSPAFQGELHARATGSTVEGLRQSALLKCLIALPKIEKQQKIADILSAYDNLIENNNKRIKILEQMAENLYKEWFVRFRFPGHESTEFENGLPKGWRKGRLSNIAKEVDKTLKVDERNNFLFYLPIDCIPNKCMNLYEVDDIINAESSLISFKSNDILFGAMRSYFHKVVIAPFNGITRTTCFVLNAIENYMHDYLYMVLYQDESVDFSSTVSVGSTMPYVRWKDFSKMNVVIPSKEIIQNFNSIIHPILEKIKGYFFINQNLTKQRDLLLPRLMSGKLEVMKEKKEMPSDKFDYIRNYWKGHQYDEENFGMAARSTDKISEDTLKKLKEIAEEE